MRLALLAGLSGLLLLGTPAQAQGQEVEALCADRPGLASTPCTVEPGRVHVELAFDWSFQDDGAERVDTLLAGDTLVRVGLDERTEVQVGWTPYGHVRTRTPAGVDRTGGVGDISLGVRHRVVERGGFSAGLQPAVSLPVGGSAIGAGDWGAELQVPIGYEVGRTEFALTPSIAAAVDADGDGRHLAYGLVAGVSSFMTDRLTAVLDLALVRDDDPLGPLTEALAGVALAWQLNPDLQLDAGAVFGLNAASPDLEIYVGAAKRF